EGDSPRGQRQLRQMIAVLLMLAVFVVLYVGRAIFIPLAAAALLSLLFKPMVRRLELWLRLPPAASAVVIVAGLFVVMLSGVYGLSGPVAAWVDDAPQYVAELEEKLRPL